MGDGGMGEGGMGDGGMRVLLIDTCGVQGTVALAAADRGVIGERVLGARTASEELMPAIRRLLEEAGWDRVDGVGVVNGPGSFTGVRTGLSVGKGLCGAWGVRLAAVSRLGLLAGSAGGRVHAVLDAGRGEFYLGSYRDGVMEREALVGRAELDVVAGEGRVVACEERVLVALAGLEIERRTEPRAGEALGAVLARLEAGLDDVLGDANYLRRTDAEIFAKAVSGAAGG